MFEPEPAPRHRVAVIDGDPWRRLGVAEALRGAGGVIEVIGHGPVGLLADTAASEVDTVLVGLDNLGEGWDRFSPVLAVQDFRAIDGLIGDGRPLVIGLSRVAGHSLLPLRALEAGVNYIARWDDVGDVAALERIVLTPQLDSRPGSQLRIELLRRLGLTTSSRLNAGIEWISERGLCEAFDDPVSQVLTRRQRITVRSRLSEVVKAHSNDNRPPNGHNQTIPSWQQLRTILRIARGESGE